MDSNHQLPGYEPGTLPLSYGPVHQLQISDFGLQIENLKSAICNLKSPERVRGFEPLASTLEEWHSTAELHPRIYCRLQIAD